MRAYISRSVEFLAGVTRPRLPVRRWRTPLTLLVLALLVGPVPAAVFGQQPARPRSVLVVPAVNRSADPALDAVAVTTLQTIEGAFARSRDFVVLSGGGRFVAEGGIPENAAVPIQLAEAGLVDYVVSGAVSRGDDGRIVIEITVWDGNTGAVAVLARESTSTLFETFAVADDLRARLLPVLGSDRASSETIVLDETRRESAGRAGSPTILGPEVTPDPPGVDPPMDVPLQGFESRPRSLVLRLQSGGGFVGAGGLDVYPGRKRTRVGIVAGTTLTTEESRPAAALSVAVEPTVGRVVVPIGVSSYVAVNADTVAIAAGVTAGFGVRFNRVIREFFLDNVIYFNTYPDAELPLVYMPVLGVRL